MITDRPAALGEIKAASALVGNAITSAATAAAAFQAFPPGTAFVYLEGRNFSTAVAIGWALNPWLSIIKTTDSLATATGATDYSAVAQDNTSTTLVTLSALATTGALWIGADLPFRGVFADVATASVAAATIVGTYSNTAGTMGALTIADGTASAGAAMGKAGAITWTVPTDWAAVSLRTIAAAVVAIPESGQPKYWAKFTFGAALSTTVTLGQVLAMNRDTTYASLTSGRPGEWFALPTGTRRAGCLEAKTDAVSANLIVNVATVGGGRFV